MANSQDEQAVKDFLSRIVEGDLSVLNTKGLGLCFNLTQYVWGQQDVVRFVDCYQFVLDACKSWTHFSGRGSYPVVADKLLGSLVYYEGEQLELRQSLAQHLLDTFEEFKHVLGEAEKV